MTFSFSDRHIVTDSGAKLHKFSRGANVRGDVYARGKEASAFRSTRSVCRRSLNQLLPGFRSCIIEDNLCIEKIRHPA